MGDLILVRHGETEWSKSGRHTGRTDIPLTAAGEARAAALAPVLARRGIRAVFTSTAARAVRTAELAGLTGASQDPDLQEWDYGGYEGRTTAQIQAERPGWYLWRDGVIPGDAAHPGETVCQVGDRVDAVLARVRPLLDDGAVALIAHAPVPRILTARPPPGAASPPPPRALRGPGRGPPVPARSRHPVHPRHRARQAGDPVLERP